MMGEIVSVVVPVYNIKEYIDRCIDSIVNQTYSEIEIIIVDDGSSDGTEQIVDEYEKKYKNIAVYHTENKGVSAARNLGISKASGKWIIFVDGDDYLENGYVETLVELMKKNSDCNLAICNHCEVDGADNKEKFNWFENVINGKIEKKDKLMLKLFGVEFCGESSRYFGTVWGRMYNLPIIIDNNILFPEKLSFGEDLDFNINYLHYAHNAYFSPRALYNYRMRSQSASREQVGKEKYIKFYDQCLEIISEYIDKSSQRALIDFIGLHSMYKILSTMGRIGVKDVKYLVNLRTGFRDTIENPKFEYFDLKKKVLWLAIRYKLAAFLNFLLRIKNKKEGII